MRDAAIRVERLSKRFGDVLAVDETTFEIEAGSVVALLGGNGAGKTTTLAMLLGLLLPSSGTVEILGVDMVRHRHRVLPRLNFSSPYVELPHRLTVRENLKVYGYLYGIRRANERLVEVAREIGIEALLDRPVRHLSSGQRTRVALAKALLNEPAVLLLDEPTASLDPDTADWVRGYLDSYRRRTGATLLLASHNMAEVERLCDLALIMHRGRIVARGSPAELLAAYGGRTLEEVFLEIVRGRPSPADEPLLSAAQ
jgi:ABC-2 type transport system ATP-binding protein